MLELIGSAPGMDLHDRRGNAPGPWGPVRPGGSGRFTRRLLVLLGIVILALVGVISVAPPVSPSSGQWGFIAGSVLVLSAAIVRIAASTRRLAAFARDLGIWIAVGLALVAGFAYRAELGDLCERVLGELMPARGRLHGGDTITFKRGADGQFWIDALVNGLPVRFLVDTGASGVALNRADAVRLGFDPDRLDYTEVFETANGATRGAPVELRQIRIGPIHFESVPAAVNEGELGQSLLGMRLLERLGSIEISQDTLTIRQ